MSDQNKNFERRVNRRFDVQLPLKLSSDGIKLETTTKNISCAGVYCRVNCFLPVMTKLELKMSIPIIEDNKKIEKKITTNAVIVRIDPEQELPGCDSYDIGLFFMNIKEEHCNLISRYIQQIFLASNN
ncbi:MAG: PilZ domain-containing protein [Candidatus Omnitrophica bacterium]|nr:PilZ domain-containing protein [Candidatus Omnitrophota bacterium]